MFHTHTSDWNNESLRSNHIEALRKPFISFDHNRVSHFLSYFLSQAAVCVCFLIHIKGSVLMQCHRTGTPKEETALLKR